MMNERGLQGRWIEEFHCVSCRSHCVGSALVIGEVALCFACVAEGMVDTSQDRADRRERGLTSRCAPPLGELLVTTL
jgi:hypothetical protein